jgi:NTP pyrophosphatase (non-canonical NTP hydrolase)
MKDDTTTVARLRQQVARFVAEREWEKYHDPKNLSMAIAIEAAELMEQFQWARSDELTGLMADAEFRGAVAAEIADVTCFVLALANALELDLATAVEAKLVKNAEKYPVETFRGRYFKPRGDQH